MAFSSSRTTVVVGVLFLLLLVWSVLPADDPYLHVRGAIDTYVKNGKKVVDDYSNKVEQRMQSSLEQLFNELDVNKDGTIQRSEFRGAKLNMMAALRAVEKNTPTMPKIALPHLPTTWSELFVTAVKCQFLFLTLLFVVEHFRAALFGVGDPFDLEDYKTKVPKKVSVQAALRYSTPVTVYERCKMAFFVLSGLLFLRLFVATVLVFTGMFFVSLSAAGGRTRRKNPVWAGACARVVEFCGTMMFVALGFHRVGRHGKLAQRSEAKLLLGNHVAVIEVIYIFIFSNLPSFVSRVENLSVPLFRGLVKACDVLLVDRDAAASRTKTLTTLKNRSADPNSLPIVMFPEGTCNAGGALFQFKRGAFEAGVPVQLVCFKFGGKHFNPSWNGRACGGNDFGDLFVRMASQFVNRLEVMYLPPYTPTEAERADSVLYAEHCQHMMANALRLPVSDAKYSDYAAMAKEEAGLNTPSKTD
jgi:lysophosphatidylcholine acyltransferase/lyso-PAF acetyltransferase